MTTKRAIVYARVSTDDQADKGFSLSAQVEAGRKYADLQGFTVSQELIDDGVSGALAFSERPAGATAWALLRSGKADVLIVQNVDRLSRDVVDLLVTVRELLRAGVEVHCLDLGRVTSEYDIMLVIRGWQGSDEREKIKERTMRGRRAKLAQGFVIGGRLPYGYEHLRDEKGRVVNFEMNAEQAAVVRLIFQWYTVGDADGIPLSLHAIAAKLTAAGIATPQKSSRKPFWDPSSLARILSNPTYKGQWEYTASATDKLPEQTFVIAVPAIIAPATWDAAQVQGARNTRKAKRNGKRDYLLTGIVTCGCGYAFTGHSKTADGVKYFYYDCNSRAHFGKHRTCTENSIRAEKLEAAAWLALRDRLENSDTLEGDMREAQRREDEEREPKTAELEAVNAMLAEAQAEADNLALAFAQLVQRKKQDGAVGRALQDRINAVDERHKRLSERREVLEAELSKRRVTEEVIAKTIAFTEGVRAGLDHATNEDKRQMLDTFNARVTVTDGKPKLALWMPGEVVIELNLSHPDQARSFCTARVWCSSSSSCTPTSSSAGIG